MAYIFDPIRNTFVDDEDTSLGNKLALNDTSEEIIRQIDEQFGPGTVFPASELPPKENPYKDFEDRNPMAGIEDETREYYLKYLEDRPEGSKGKPIPLKTFAPEFIKENAADGGMIRQNFAVAGLALPALSYPITLSLAKILGVSTAGAGAVELGDRVTDYLKENPQVFNDPRFKAAALTFGINIPGVIAPDADEMEREAEKIRELTKPVGSPAETEKMPIKTGETTPPEIDTKESFPADTQQLPNVEGFPADTQQLPIIFENKKADIDSLTNEESKKIKKSDLKKDFKKESWKEKPIVSGSYAKGTRSISAPGENIGFFEDLNSFANQEHGGNLKNAVKDITGLDKKSKEFKNVYGKIQQAAKTRDFKFDLQGLKLPQNLLVEGEKNNFSDLTTILKTNPEILKNKLKPLIEKGVLNRNKVYNKAELAEIFGIDITSGTKKENIRQASNFMEVLAKNGAKYKELPGGKKGFALYEAENALLDYSRIKQIRGDENKSDVRGLRISDDPGFENFRENFYGYMKKNISNLTLPGGEKLMLPDSTAQVGHNPIPIAYKKTLKMFKDKKLSDKIFNLGNLTFQDSEINRETLMRTSGKLLSNLKIIDRHYGKNVSKNNIDELTKAKKGIEEYFKKANVSAKEKSEEFGFVDKDVIGQFTFNIPKIGEKITEKNIKVDMSNVGKQYIVGYVDQINKKAVKFNDLNDKQKKKYAQNFLDQKIAQIKSFYKSAKYDPEMIEEIVDALLVGTMPSDTDFTEGVLEKKLFKIKKADGGSIKLSPMPRVDFNGGGAVGADDDFAKELEYFLLNPDAELPKADSYRETMNPVALVNDMIDPRNYAYYGDRLAETGIRIGEFGARVLPALGQLTADLIRKPAFKVTGGTGQGYIQDYDEVLPSNIKGTGIFTEFLDNLVGTEGTKVITEKTGLKSLIESEEQKQKDRRSTIGPKVLADQVTLGVELTAPIFPGLKLLKAYAKNRKLPVNDTTKEIMNKEIDEVLSTQNLTRRDFLKATGAGGAVILAKMLGFGDELATTTKVVEKATKETVATGGVPPYFFNLVKKIKKMGDETIATKDKATAYKYDDYYMEEDFAGNIEIKKTNYGMFGDEIAPTEEVYMSYRVDEVPIKGKEGSRKVEEYEEYTARPDEDGKMKDVEDGVPDDVIEEGTLFEDNITDFNK